MVAVYANFFEINSPCACSGSETRGSDRPNIAQNVYVEMMGVFWVLIAGIPTDTTI